MYYSFLIVNSSLHAPDKTFDFVLHCLWKCKKKNFRESSHQNPPTWWLLSYCMDLLNPDESGACAAVINMLYMCWQHLFSKVITPIRIQIKRKLGAVQIWFLLRQSWSSEQHKANGLFSLNDLTHQHELVTVINPTLAWVSKHQNWIVCDWLPRLI